MRRCAALVLLLAGACSKRQANACDGGYLFHEGQCALLCDDSAFCPAGSCCQSGLCVASEVCAPVVHSVNGLDPGNSSQVEDRVVIQGENLLRAQAFLAPLGATAAPEELEQCEPATATQMTVALPDGIVPDNYTLTVRNAAGECATTLPLLQGLPGSPDNGTDILAKLAPVDGSGSGLDADTLDGASLEDIVEQAMPVGTVLPFAGDTAAVPPGWLPCDGRAVSRTTYAALFAVITVTYGNGDQVTTFNLPDLRGRAPIGAGQGAGLTMRNVGQPLGTETHTLSLAEMPAHNHNLSDPGHSHSINLVRGYLQSNASTNTPEGIYGSQNTGASTTGITLQTQGAGTPHNNMPPSLPLTFIIKH